MDAIMDSESWDVICKDPKLLSEMMKSSKKAADLRKNSIIVID